MTYLWVPAQPIQMRTRNGYPTQFLWQERSHRVLWIAAHWRIDIEWWEQRIWRHSYKLTTNTGLLIVVYCDLIDGGWYLQQVYD